MVLCVYDKDHMSALRVKNTSESRWSLNVFWALFVTARITFTCLRVVLMCVDSESSTHLNEVLSVHFHVHIIYRMGVLLWVYVLDVSLNVRP